MEIGKTRVIKPLKKQSIVLDFIDQDKSHFCLVLFSKYLFVLLKKAKCQNC